MANRRVLAQTDNFKAWIRLMHHGVPKESHANVAAA
jgi:hypothetical protein